MVGDFDTVWPRYKALIIFWLFTLGLIISALVIQGLGANLPNRFTTVKGTENCPLQINVTYPTRLFLPSINSPEQELIIQIAANEEIVYKISLEKANWFVLYDKDGNAIPPYWEGQGNAIFAVQVKAYPDQMTSQQEHKISLVGDDKSISCVINLNQITLETVNESRWRIGLDIFARNIALPLGLLSAITGWVISYLSKETDKAENDFHEKMGNLSDEFQKDPVYVIEQCRELKKNVRKRRLGRDSDNELGSIVHYLFQESALKEIIKQLGLFAEQGNIVRLETALAAVSAFYVDFSSYALEKKSKDFFETIYKIRLYQAQNAKNWGNSLGTLMLSHFIHRLENLLTSPFQNFLAFIRWLHVQQKRKQTRFIVKKIFIIWDEFDVYSVSLVSYLLTQMRKNTDMATCKYIKECLEMSSSRKRLIRHKPFEKEMKDCGLILPGEYILDCPIVLPLLEEGQLLEWLNRNSQCKIITKNPFSIDLLEETWIPPLGWDGIISLKSHSFFKVHDKQDMDICTNRLWFKLQQEEKSSSKGTFIIYWNLVPDSRFSDGITRLVHYMSEAWIHFLLHNPDAFLDLHPDERHAIVAYLGWHIGSLPALILRLRQLVLSIENEEKEREYQFLFELLEKEKTPFSKDICPTHEQFLDWLSIRPPWFEYTALIITHHELPNSEWQCLFKKYKERLLKSKVVLKEFICIPNTDTASYPVLRWDNNDMITMLGSRIGRTTPDNRTDFTSLFNRFAFSSPLEADQKLVSRANGSLNQMLSLGTRILLHHIECHPDEPELFSDDFGVIENS